jgi:hypothetical protein
MWMIREGHVARIRETINAYRLLLRKPEGKGPLGRPSRKWEGSVTIGLERTGWDVSSEVLLAGNRNS